MRDKRVMRVEGTANKSILATMMRPLFLPVGPSVANMRPRTPDTGGGRSDHLDAINVGSTVRAGAQNATL